MDTDLSEVPVFKLGRFAVSKKFRLASWYIQNTLLQRITLLQLLKLIITIKINHWDIFSKI
ncbi:hypothetical protein ES742_18325 [Salmonella enterica]|nr:hypothetical protein [Salmonella enterica]